LSFGIFVRLLVRARSCRLWFGRFFRSFGAFRFLLLTHGLRRGLYSYAALLLAMPLRA